MVEIDYLFLKVEIEEPVYCHHDAYLLEFRAYFDKNVVFLEDKVADIIEKLELQSS